MDIIFVTVAECAADSVSQGQYLPSESNASDDRGESRLMTFLEVTKYKPILFSEQMWCLKC